MSGNIFEGDENWTDNNYMALNIEQLDGTLEDWRMPEPEIEEKFLPHTDETLEAYERVLDSAGASIFRDTVDERVINNVRNRKGRVIDSQNDVGGFPVLHTSEPPLDSDGDGLPDWWEVEHDLDPESPFDGNDDRNGDGYTNLEEYLTWMTEF